MNDLKTIYLRNNINLRVFYQFLNLTWLHILESYIKKTKYSIKIINNYVFIEFICITEMISHLAYW